MTHDRDRDIDIGPNPMLLPAAVWSILHGGIYTSEVRIWISGWPSVSGFVLFNKRLSYKFKYESWGKEKQWGVDFSRERHSQIP